MFNFSTDTLIIILMVYITILAFLITINTARGIAKNVISYFLATLLLIFTTITGITKIYVAISEKKIQQEQLEKQKLLEEKKKLEMKVMKTKQSEEDQKIYNQEKVQVVKDLNKAISILSAIAAVSEDKYDEILEDDYLYEKYQNRSYSYYLTMKKLLKKYKNKTFKSSIGDHKQEIIAALKKGVYAAKIFKIIFYDEDDSYLPKHIYAARKAISSIKKVKNSL